MEKSLKKHYAIIAGAVVGLITISLFAMIPFKHKAAKATLTSWMGKISNETSLREISIPGSHASGSRNSIGDLTGKCQDLSIEDQLNNGVRYLDFGLALVNNEIRISDNGIDQKMTLADAMKSLRTFLNSHKSEAVFLALHQSKEASRSSSDLTTMLNAYLGATSNTTLFSSIKAIPETLTDIRGKAVVLADYPGATFGIPVEDWDRQVSGKKLASDIHLQDKNLVDDIDEKKSLISDSFGVISEFALSINYASACYADEKIPYLSSHVAKEINSWLLKELENHNRTGVLATDFVNPDLTSAIITKNGVVL